MAQASFFGQPMDRLARRAGGWPPAAVPYEVEVIGDGRDPQVMLTGKCVVGVKRNGDPRLDRKGDKFRAVIKLSQYRAALSKARDEQVAA